MVGGEGQGEGEGESEGKYGGGGEGGDGVVGKAIGALTRSGFTFREGFAAHNLAVCGRGSKSGRGSEGQGKGQGLGPRENGQKSSKHGI